MHSTSNRNILCIPVQQVGSSRFGTLHHHTPVEIAKKLGFGPNCNELDDPGKVSHSWGFTLNGHRCGIWSYKGSEMFNQYSVWWQNPEGLVLLKKLFGNSLEVN